MLREIRIASILGMFLAVGAQAGVVKVHGALKVQGTHIVDAHGNPIQLAGMSLYWSTFGGSTANWGANQFFNANVVATMANDWKASLIRAPAGVISGSGQNVYNYPSTMNLVKTVVDAAIANDIYVIVDWHLENSTPDLADATRFFTEMSHTYKSTPNIIWEIWNEPKNVAWADIKSYANTMIPIIRDSSSNLIVVGTPNWSHNPDQAGADPITIDNNVAYTLHFYADQNDPTGSVDADNNTEMAAANTAIQKVPLFITEWGTVNNSGAGNVNTSWSDRWLAWAQSNGVSWANWSLSNINEAASALIPSAGSNGGWSAGQLSASGTYVKAKIQEVGAAISPSSPGGDSTNPPPADTSDTLVIPGHIEAESYTNLSTEGIKSETVGGITDLGYTSNGSWAEYLARVTQSGTFTLAARVASDASGTLTFKWNGATLGSMQVASTGGWSTWQTQSLPVQLNSAGVGTLRLEWSGSGSSLVNLDWMQFNASDAGLAGENAARGFSLRPTDRGLSVSLPTGAREVQVTDLRGRTLAHRSVVGLSQVQIGIGGRGLVLVRVTGVAGEAVLPVLLPN